MHSINCFFFTLNVFFFLSSRYAFHQLFLSCDSNRLFLSASQMCHYHLSMMCIITFYPSNVSILSAYQMYHYYSSIRYIIAVCPSNVSLLFVHQMYHYFLSDKYFITFIFLHQWFPTWGHVVGCLGVYEKKLDNSRKQIKKTATIPVINNFANMKGNSLWK